MSVAEEADAGVLVGEAGGGGELVEDIAPALRDIEGGVDHREAGDQAHIAQIAEPLAVLGGQLLAGPLDRLGGVRIEALQGFIHRAVLVVISLHAGHAHAAHNLEAFTRVGAVADHVANATIVRALLFLGVGEYDLERLQIRMNVSYDRVLHCLLYRTISKPL